MKLFSVICSLSFLKRIIVKYLDFMMPAWASFKIFQGTVAPRYLFH